MIEEEEIAMGEVNHAVDLSLNDISNVCQLNDRRYSSLMVAAEAGHLDVVNSLIHRGEDIDFTVNKETPASLAFSKGHHNVLLTLLKANAKLPANYNPSEASKELKDFVELSEKLHLKIRDENGENISSIFVENPSVRHFYDSKNNSALRTAIVCGVFAIIEILLKHNIFLAPHEELEQVLSALSTEKRKQLRKIFFKFSPHLFSDTMMTLMRNCRFGPDGTRHPDYMNFVCRAFHVLLENPYTAIVLKIVAANRNFVFVFDFNREWVDFVDPTSEPYTNGNCYLSGIIYIAAANMLDPKKFVEITSVIAHELCHYAIFLVFSNEAKPYRDDDTFGREMFSRIAEFCRRRHEGEKLIRSVYECYPVEMFHAELVVRAPQMLIYYHDKPELLDEKCKSLFNLMGDYKCRVVPAMQRALPAIQAKYRLKFNHNEHIWRSLLLFLLFALAMGICIYHTFNEWNNLESLKDKFYVDRCFHSKLTRNVSFEDLVENLQSERLFLLSDVAGEGKTYTFRNLAVKLKHKFPNKWVQYLDMKKHLSTFELFKDDDSLGDLSKLQEYFKVLLTSNNLKLSNYEESYFPLLFKFGEVVFLYDGVDEISPKYFNFITNLILKVKELTKNVHLVSTRPLYQEDLESKLEVEAHRFEPLNDFTKNAILSSVVMDSVECRKLIKANSNCSAIVERVKEVVRSVETSETGVRHVMNPILIMMFANVAVDEDFKVEGNFNNYKLYEEVVYKKLRVVSTKGDVVYEATKRIEESRRKEVHQAYAISFILESYLNGTSANLQQEISDLKSKLNASTISLYGMIQVNHDGLFEFSHRTIAEFFVVQYFTEKLSIKDFNVDVFLLFHTVISLDLHVSSEGVGVVNSFFLNYCKTINLTAEPFWATANEVILSHPRIKNITNDVDWRTKTSLARFYFALKSFGLNVVNFSSWTREELSKIIKNYEILTISVSPMLKDFILLLQVQDLNGNRLLHAVAESHDDLLIPFFTQLKGDLSMQDLLSVMRVKNNANKDVLSILEGKEKYELFKSFMNDSQQLLLI